MLTDNRLTGVWCRLGESYTAVVQQLSAKQKATPAFELLKARAKHHISTSGGNPLFTALRTNLNANNFNQLETLAFSWRVGINETRTNWPHESFAGLRPISYTCTGMRQTLRVQLATTHHLRTSTYKNTSNQRARFDHAASSGNRYRYQYDSIDEGCRETCSCSWRKNERARLTPSSSSIHDVSTNGLAVDTVPTLLDYCNAFLDPRATCCSPRTVSTSATTWQASGSGDATASCHICGGRISRHDAFACIKFKRGWSVYTCLESLVEGYISNVDHSEDGTLDPQVDWQNPNTCSRGWDAWLATFRYCFSNCPLLQLRSFTVFSFQPRRCTWNSRTSVVIARLRISHMPTHIVQMQLLSIIPYSWL